MITKKRKLFWFCILFDYDELRGVTFKRMLIEVQEQGKHLTMPSGNFRGY